MTIKRVNRQGKTYYLHQGETKSGRPNYYFSLKAEGNLVETVPDGYEIYENPNAQVFLRRVRSKIVSDEEVALVEQGVATYAEVQHYLIDVKDKAIVVYLADQDTDLLEGLGGFASPSYLAERLARLLNYTAMMRFILHDEQARTFFTQRYCFRGAIDDWIDLSPSASLAKQVRKFAPHLGQESFYDLHWQPVD